MNRDTLRDVNVDGYRLTLWDTNRSDSMGKSVLGYEFKGPDGSVIFQGEDFHCSPVQAVDSDETVRSLLTFLTLRPGDTDADYFADYTPEQIAFTEGDAEALSIFALEDGPDFTDWQD
jgi:hypothetical protein